MDDDRRFALRIPPWLASCLPRRPGRAVLGAAAFAFVAGLTLIRTSTEFSGGPPQPDAAPRYPPARAPGSPGGEKPQTAEPPPAHPPLGASEPTRVRIPSIGVDAALTAVGLDPQGLLDVPPPRRTNLAGWYDGAVTPGARGTAVIVGHVDNEAGPAVFFRLGALRRGATVTVDRTDGSTAVFTVHSVEVHEKDGFPAERVYRDTGRAELRVITCGGGYAEPSGYLGNVVAYARLTDVR